jgi:membrane associated rhomboid family serine protease
LGAGIAWWAHAGGFVAGVGLLYLLAPDDRRPMPWDHLRKG